MIKEILNDVIDRLKQVEELRYVAEENAQLEYEEPRCEFPCALVDIDNIDYQNLTQQAQRAFVSININIAAQVYDVIGSATNPDRVLSESQYFDVCNKVFRTLQNYSADAAKYTGFERQATRRVKRTDKLREMTVIFQSSYIEEF